jgi:hypothetical protein
MRKTVGIILSGPAIFNRAGQCDASPADVPFEAPGVALVPIVGHEHEGKPRPSRVVEAHGDRELPIFASERLRDHANAALA